MDSLTWVKVKTIFYEAKNMSGEEREKFVNSTCKETELKNEINALLSSYDKAGQFLEGCVFKNSLYLK